MKLETYTSFFINCNSLHAAALRLLSNINAVL